MPDLARPNLPLPAPVTTLRGWLDDLAAHDRLAIIPPGGITLRHELAAISKRLDGQKATLRHLIENFFCRLKDVQADLHACGQDRSELRGRQRPRSVGK